MNAREAKDFLVHQAVEQAALEGVPLSDLERGMMYFTESGDRPEDPLALNDAFENQYDTKTYERKISRLMAKAYRRIKKESPDKERSWNHAYRALSKGDHYIFCSGGPGSKRPRALGGYML
jgi:hypothetical protein